LLVRRERLQSFRRRRKASSQSAQRSDFPKTKLAKPNQIAELCRLQGIHLGLCIYIVAVSWRSEDHIHAKPASLLALYRPTCESVSFVVPHIQSESSGSAFSVSLTIHPTSGCWPVFIGDIRHSRQGTRNNGLHAWALSIILEPTSTSRNLLNPNSSSHGRFL
jgi:hypothetical protein